MSVWLAGGRKDTHTQTHTHTHEEVHTIKSENDNSNNTEEQRPLWGTPFTSAEPSCLLWKIQAALGGSSSLFTFGASLPTGQQPNKPNKQTNKERGHHAPSTANNLRLANQIPAINNRWESPRWSADIGNVEQSRPLPPGVEARQRLSIEPGDGAGCCRCVARPFHCKY